MPQLAEILLERIDPVLDRFVLEITTLFEAHIEAELARFGAAFESALSAFVSEVEHADSDRRDHDPVPRVRRGPKRGLRDNEARGQGRADPSARDGKQPRAAQAPDQGRGEGQRAPGLVGRALGPDLAAMMRPAADVVRRDIKPSNAIRAPRSEGHAAPAIMQPRPCGCAPRGPHRRDCIQVPVTKREPAFEPSAVPPPPVRRLKAKPEALASRMSAIAQRATKPFRPPEDENDTDRWPQSRVTAEREIAESQKKAGMLPTPSSTYYVAPRSTGGLGDVEEREIEVDR